MLRIFVSIFILSGYLYSCAMCQLEIPKVEVYTKIISDTNKTKFEIEWKFHKEFVNTLTQYDLNENGTFEESEQKAIKDSLIDYLKQFNYLTNIEYKHKDEDFKKVYEKNLKPYFSELLFTEDGMVYRYKFYLDFKLQENYKLLFKVDDFGGNFNFYIKDVVIDGYKGFKKIIPIESNYKIYFYDNNIVENKVDTKDTVEQNILSKTLTQIKSSLENILKDIKENNSVLSYFWLLFFSFLYGIIHAIGPGHGKSLVSSYFLNQDKSYLKALSISTLIGIVHTFSAFLLTLVVYYSIGFIFNSQVTNIEYLATKISAVIIILIALYLIYKKVKKNKTKFVFKASKQPSFILNTSNNNIDTLSCGCSGCKTTSTDIGVILAAGIVPCPGTVTVFIFTMSLGIYFVGFLSAVFMSLGMSLVIFIMAYLSIKVRKKP